MLIVNRGERIIFGCAVPYGPIGRVSAQMPRRFPPGSLTWGERPPVLIEHNSSLRVGRVVEFFDCSNGLWVALQASRQARGDRGLAYAEKVDCGLSIGLADDAVFAIAEDGILECVSAHIVEITLTRNPVFR